jgi:hypothetical protein
MNLAEAQQMFEENKHLELTHYKGKEISAIIIMEKGSDLLAIGQAARLLLQHGEHWPNKSHKEYELFVLYDLQGWLSSQPLQFGTLQSLLFHLNK